MNAALARNAYRQSETQTKIHPVKLIHLMYERTLALLEMAQEGIKQNNPQMRGENLGKSIALITELNASVKEDDTTEAAQFLRGLYGTILAELPKASTNNDVRIIQQSWVYINRLKDIWEKTAMAEAGQHFAGEIEVDSEIHEEAYNDHHPKVDVAGGLSVSI